MKVIGLTGPIGSGKSEASKTLRKLDAYVIEADTIGHELFQPQTKVWSRLVQEFGSEILQSEGKINRRKLAGLVFSDPKKLKTLNSITHPYIRQKIEEEINSCKKLSSSFKFVVVDAALPELFEGLVDETWVVYAPKEKRVKRLMQSGFTKTEINRRMKSQPSQKEYSKIADKLLKNDKSIQKLNGQIYAFLA